MSYRKWTENEHSESEQPRQHWEPWQEYWVLLLLILKKIWGYRELVNVLSLFWSFWVCKETEWTNLIVVLTLSNTFFKLSGSLEVGKEKCSDKNQSALKPRKSWESWVSAAGRHEFTGWTKIKKLLDWLQLGLCPTWVIIYQGSSNFVPNRLAGFL